MEAILETVKTLDNRELNLLIQRLAEELQSRPARKQRYVIQTGKPKFLQQEEIHKLRELGFTFATRDHEYTNGLWRRSQPELLSYVEELQQKYSQEQTTKTGGKANKAEYLGLKIQEVEIPPGKEPRLHTFPQLTERVWLHCAYGFDDF